ncbi:MMPL family transporter [Nonomuraea sp. NPDC048892]|uniref:MMPL family transporter n=1 Tax=Nonomuraea sp. NPDC048892 TaxID=3154624 RepID=UPI003406F26D
MRQLSAFVLRHKIWVILFWTVTAVFGGWAASIVPDRLANDYSFPDEPAFKANTAIQELYGNGGATEPLVAVIHLPAGQRGGSPAVKEGMERASAALFQQARVRLLPRPDDGGLPYALALLPEERWGEPIEYAPIVAEALRASLPAGSEVAMTGIKELEDQVEGVTTDSVVIETLIAGAGALIVLLWVFGSALAVLPLVVATVSIMVSFLLTLGLTEITDVNATIQYLIALIGLGVAVDYSLLLVNRWREERRTEGMSAEEAIHRAMESAGRAVVFSGLTVAGGLGTLIVLPVPFIRSIGLGSMLIPLVSTLVTLSLVPVLLASIGKVLEWPRRGRGVPSGAVWRRWAGFVVRRPLISLLVGLAMLSPLLVAATTMRLGDPVSTALQSEGSAGTALTELERGGVPRGVLTPIEVLAPSGVAPETVAQRLAAVEGVHAAVAPDSPAWRQRGTAMVSVLPAAETSTPAGQDTVERVTAFARNFPGVQIGGRGALTIDSASALYRDFPYMLAAILVFTFIVLSRAFRSVILAGQAIILGMISIAASYGILALVWQEGHGSGLLWGVEATGAIALWVPLVVFAFLFGLSMDYEVFLLARMREEYDATGSTRTAVLTGLGQVGRLVTSAALILFLAFVLLSTIPVVDLKIAATGLGAGILLDATVLRAILVPALVALTGAATWWLPRWMATALRVRETVPPVKEDARVDG